MSQSRCPCLDQFTLVRYQTLLFVSSTVALQLFQLSLVATKNAHCLLPNPQADPPKHAALASVGGSTLALSEEVEDHLRIPPLSTTIPDNLPFATCHLELRLRIRSHTWTWFRLKGTTVKLRLSPHCQQAAFPSRKSFGELEIEFPFLQSVQWMNSPTSLVASSNPSQRRTIWDWQCYVQSKQPKRQIPLRIRCDVHSERKQAHPICLPRKAWKRSQELTQDRTTVPHLSKNLALTEQCMNLMFYISQ